MALYVHQGLDNITESEAVLLHPRCKEDICYSCSYQHMGTFEQAALPSVASCQFYLLLRISFDSPNWMYFSYSNKDSH